MAKEKPSKYVAVTGIDFEGISPPIRVEAGDPIPAGKLDANSLKDLLEAGLIAEGSPRESGCEK